MIRTLFVILVGIAAPAGGPFEPVFASGPRALGWAEHVVILPEKLKLNAKMDTGAQTTSIDTGEITRFEKSGRPWVRFSIPDRSGNATVLERPVIRIVKVKRSGLKDLRRPVVMLALCIGGLFREEAVTLSDRSNLRYSLLIGRSAMEGRFMVDSSRKYTAAADCFPRR